MLASFWMDLLFSEIIMSLQHDISFWEWNDTPLVPPVLLQCKHTFIFCKDFSTFKKLLQSSNY